MSWTTDKCLKDGGVSDIVLKGMPKELSQKN